MVDDIQRPRSHFSERAHYLAALLDSLEDQISVIDRDGVIHYTNLAWDLFAEQNGMPKGYNWIGVNYMGLVTLKPSPLDWLPWRGSSGLSVISRRSSIWNTPATAPTPSAGL